MWQIAQAQYRNLKSVSLLCVCDFIFPWVRVAFFVRDCEFMFDPDADGNDAML